MLGSHSNKIDVRKTSRKFYDISQSVDKKTIVSDNLIRWSLQQQIEFIESCLLNVPTQPIYIHETMGEPYFKIVDGNQRIRALMEFMYNGFCLEDLKILMNLNDRCFKYIDVKYQECIEDMYMPVYYITGDINIIKLIMKRINMKE